MHDSRFEIAESFRDRMIDAFLPSEHIFTYEAGDADTDGFAYVTMDMAWIGSISGKPIPVAAKVILDRMTYCFKLTYDEVEDDGGNIALYPTTGPEFWTSVYIDAADDDRSFDVRAFGDGSVRVLITIDKPEEV